MKSLQEQKEANFREDNKNKLIDELKLTVNQLKQKVEKKKIKIKKIQENNSRSGQSYEV